jgi:hypothetical protein
MSRQDHPPFARGETYANGGEIDANNLGGVNLEGKEFIFEVNAPNDPSGADPSGRPIHVRVVRNASGVNLKPRRVVRYKAADPLETQVDGYVSALADRPAGVVDEFLPAAGVPANDLFYIVIDGPTELTQPATHASLAIGDRLVPAAGTSATNDDAGRVAKQDLTGATATLANNIQNVIGYAGQAHNVTNGTFKAVVHRARR